MAIFHYTVKIVGRSKGKSIISASAYLNGDVMKNEETGRISYYTSKREVVYTSLMMCENAPQEWQNVPAENIKRFQKSVRYKRADNKEVVLEKFKLTFQKQCLWNEVLKIEKSSDAQLGRSFEFSLPKEWNRQEQIEYTTDYIQKNFVDKGMCADWSIHDKGDGNPHVHLLVTMRPFNPDHSWGNKEVKDWEFVRDTDGNIVVDAGVKAADATITKSKLDYEDGRQVYDIEWYAGGAKYDYEIATDTGEIISSAYEEKTMGTDSKNITVSEADAKKTALDRVSGATDKDLYEWKLDYDDGRPEYEGKIIYGGTEYEFTIDAATGSVMEWDAEKVR